METRDVRSVEKSERASEGERKLKLSKLGNYIKRNKQKQHTYKQRNNENKIDYYKENKTSLIRTNK